jgi:branched-subunit amino acid transport protein
MSDAWLVVAVVGVATMILRAVGPVFLGGRDLPAPVMAVVRLLAPAVLAALVVVQVFAGDREIVVDERLVGLAAAAVALVLRAPLIIVVVIAAVAAALTRLALG